MTRTRRARRATRAALLLYPPAWRTRYGDEVAALVDDSGGGTRAIASVAWRAVPAWIWPPRHLRDASSQVRASLSAFLPGWTALVGLSLVFLQLTQFQGFRPSGHPVVAVCYALADGALAVSLLSAVLGGLPLWLVMLRRARREHRTRDTAYLLLPVIVPVTYLAAVGTATATGLAGPAGVSAPVFGGIVLAGFAAAAAACAGPILAMRRLRPRGPAVRLAAGAAGVAAAAIAMAGLAACVAAIGLCSWAPDFAVYHQAGPLVGFLALVVAAVLTVTVGAVRGVRALSASR
jgi:hypothetical protein